MRTYTRAHLGDGALIGQAKSHFTQERDTSAELLADLAEIDARRLFADAGFPSMSEFCVHELGLSEHSAFKRIRVARVAREFPAIFGAIADGRLSMSAVLVLKCYLTRENAEELLEAAAKRTRVGLAELIAARFPKSEMLGLVQPISAPETNGSLAPGPVDGLSPSPSTANCEGGELAPGLVEPRSTAKPHAPGRFAYQFTVGKTAHEKFQYARELLSHAVPPGDIAAVFERLLDLAIPRLEKAKFAATDRPRAARNSKDPHHIPAHVRRAVWERDQGRCTFVSEDGHCCGSCEALEFDHIVPLAQGGESTVENVRLLCHAHNQFEAERIYGAGFMEEMRAAAKRAAEVRRAAAGSDPRLERQRETAGREGSSASPSIALSAMPERWPSSKIWRARFEFPAYS
jgi:5-methylcytosine-specific restriction endonuclease McrA